MDQPQNLYPAQNGQVGGVEPLMYNQGQPMVTAQPIPQASSMAPMNQPIVDPIYGTQPIYQIPNQNQPIVVNQIIPVSPIQLKTNPVSTVCPFCRNNITTVVETEFNCLNCCFCCWNMVLWLIVQLVREKELNCTNATHKCPMCHRIIGQYNAC